MAPFEAGSQAHCRRVAAWAAELAALLKTTPGQRAALEKAALAHHVPLILLDEHSLGLLLSDLHVREASPPAVIGQTALLESYHRLPGRSSNSEVARLAAVLEIAHALDESFEWEPYESEERTESDPVADTALGYLQVTTRADLARVVDKLPVFPAAAQRALRLLSRDDWAASDLEAIARHDQTLAAHLIRAANSALNGTRQSITTLSRAIMQIGAGQAARILFAASLRPLFASAALRRQWNHSLEAAQTAERLAEISGEADPGEAFLCGLLHDIGRLAMALLPLEFQERYARLFEKGCPPVLIEQALSGCTHAEGGAITLKAWSFPDALVDAIEYHHRPERSASKLAALLYLTEHWLDTEEDLPSTYRLTSALTRLNLNANLLRQSGLTPSHGLEDLRFAA
jgi:putative nucleotidyltransferase with HDIG domain